MSSDEKKKIAWLPWICVALAFTTLAGGLYWTIAIEAVKVSSHEERAQLGDFWGGHLGAVSSFAASLLFLAGLLFQSRELSLQREELKETRKEMKNNTASQKEQAEMMERSAKISAASQIYNHYTALLERQIADSLIHHGALGKQQWSLDSFHILTESDERSRKDLIKESKLYTLILYDHLKALCEKPDRIIAAKRDKHALDYAAEYIGRNAANPFITNAELRHCLFRLNQMLWVFGKDDDWVDEFFNRSSLIFKNDEIGNYIEELRSEVELVSYRV